MTKAQSDGIRWLEDVVDDDYTAAGSYLSILYNAEQVVKVIARLREAAVVEFKAVDLLRASRLPTLDASEPNVKKERKKILKGESLSPLLLVRDEQNGKVEIADGYHRLCALNDYNREAAIRCKIV
jgi:predicted Ser/Thr protein kinase